MKHHYIEKLWFPVRVWELASGEHLLNRTLHDVQITEFRSYNTEGGVGTSFPHLEQWPQWKALKIWFEECANELVTSNGWVCERLSVTSMWANRSDAKTGHHHTPHRHPMSYLSGIYYVQGSAPTMFVDPLAQREWAQLHLDGGPLEETRLTYSPPPGTLLLFPSYLVHGSIPNDRNEDRYTIAVNFFPAGKINLGAWDEPMLTLDIK